MSKSRTIRRANRGRRERKGKGRMSPLTDVNVRSPQYHPSSRLADKKKGSIVGTANEKGKKLILMKGTETDYPELWMKVYVEATAFEMPSFAGMFSLARCRKADKPEDADIVVFSGGPDVDPVFYGERPHASTQVSPSRDSTDLALYKKCLDNGIPMVGICRGAQFLHVMNGGKLYQDVDNHYGEHNMWDLKNKKMVYDVSSVHHQMVRPNFDNGMEIISESHISTRRWIDDKTLEKGSKRDIESFFYRDTCCFGVQGHPEYSGYTGFTLWFLKMVEDLIILNPDVKWTGDNLRIMPDLLAQRKEGWTSKKVGPNITIANAN